MYDNAEFAAGCVDGLAPVGPSLNARGHGGTCIVWDAELSSKITVLPETNKRIIFVQLKQDG